MGWFLKSKPTRKTRAKDRKPDMAPKPWDPQRTLAALQLIGVLVVLAGLVLGWTRIERSLIEYADRRKDKPLEKEQVALENAPSWMSPGVADELRAQVAAVVRGSPMDNAGLQRAAQQLSINPWVKRVARVERTADGTIVLAASYREPLALVYYVSKFKLIDTDGILLPLEYDLAQARKVQLPIISGVSTAPHMVGRPWPGEETAAGIALVKLLQGEPYLGQIEAFDVSQRDSRNRVTMWLKTHRGMVRWGLPPTDLRPIEPDPATKKIRLATLYKRKGSIDAGGQIVEINGAEILERQQSAIVQDTNVNVAYSWNR